MTVEFVTRDYEFSHGRPPRGRGTWAFAFKHDGSLADAWWAPGELSYAEAKKLAAAEARARRVSRVWVLP